MFPSPAVIRWSHLICIVSISFSVVIHPPTFLVECQQDGWGRKLLPQPFCHFLTFYPDVFLGELEGGWKYSDYLLLFAVLMPCEHSVYNKHYIWKVTVLPHEERSRLSTWTYFGFYQHLREISVSSAAKLLLIVSVCHLVRSRYPAAQSNPWSSMFNNELK